MVDKSMFTAENVLSVAVTLVFAAFACWSLPDFYRKLKLARAELKGDSQKKEQITLPALVARAPQLARYFLVLGLITGSIGIFLLVKGNF
jgi:hypothetical protein